MDCFATLAMTTQINNKAEQEGLEIIAKLKVALEFEMQHQYINAVGKAGDFAYFVRQQARAALKLFKNSNHWELIFTLMERYPMQDLSSRMQICKRVMEKLGELKELYLQKAPLIEKPKAEPKAIDPNMDISDYKVQFIKGIGPSLGARLEKLGIISAEDLLNYLPRDHIAYSDVTLIKDLELESSATIMGFIHKVTAFKSSKNNLVILTILIKDNSGTLKINKYFQGNSAHFYLKQYKGTYPEGSHVICVGQVKKDKFSKQKTLANPAIEIISEDFSETERNTKAHTAKIVPIYPLTEGLSLLSFRKLIFNVLSLYKGNLREFIPANVLEKNALVSYQHAIEEIHFPTSLEAKNQAAARLIFQDFFLMQLKFMQLRYQHKHRKPGIKFNCFEQGLIDKFINALPFELTHAQQRVFFNEILPDMVSSQPMHRLLQGDVGSGKTVVAFLAVLVAIADGYQTAIMVPTEILAEQHYKKFVEWVKLMQEELNIKVGILLGKQKASEKKKILEGLANGSINLVVGTHALIQEAVVFKKLGLIVIDEQHRFGVKQRELLARKVESQSQQDEQLSLSSSFQDMREEIDNKLDATVEKLFMTATPIPRTLALALHGDLDMSEIDEMPSGRKPIITQVISRKNDAYKLIKDELDQGHQAYIVFPLIDESEALAAKAATVEYEKLKETAFKDYSLGLLHGKMKDEEKEVIMQEFRQGKIHILISTTVIEVGVDVPAATVMMIESAERFGLAQLHQLRGRVGRNDLQSYCLLSSSSKTPTVYQRLNILCKTNNGFIIAQEDLKIRGSGDLTGLKQSGMQESSINGLLDQEELLLKAREAAKELVNSNPELDKHDVLKKKLNNNKFVENINAG